ncbi:MAG: hypothetical protein LBT40_11310 [Deltaproteobacteria bacterium]|nr:hypothetical protein [Deltaproteobacteria bacterium]
MARDIDIMFVDVNKDEDPGKIMINSVFELRGIADIAVEKFCGFWGLKGRRPDMEVELVSEVITECRAECRRALDFLGWIESSGWRLSDEDRLCVFSSVAVRLSRASRRAEDLLDGVGGKAGLVVAGLMGDFRYKAACLEQMSYLWLGRRGLPCPRRSRTGCAISVAMSLGPKRPVRSREVWASIERMAEHGRRLMKRAQKERKASGSSGGK